jgi:hypothetical protein
MEKDGVTRIYFSAGDPLDVEHEYFPVDRGPNGYPWNRHHLGSDEIHDVIRNNDCVVEYISSEEWRVVPEARLRPDTFNEDGSLHLVGGKAHIDPPTTGSFTIERPRDTRGSYNEMHALVEGVERKLGQAGLTLILA